MGIVPSVFFVIQRAVEPPDCLAVSTTTSGGKPISAIQTAVTVARGTSTNKKIANSKVKSTPMNAKNGSDANSTNSNGNLAVDESQQQQLVDALQDAMSAKQGRARAKSSSITKRQTHSREHSTGDGSIGDEQQQQQPHQVATTNANQSGGGLPSSKKSRSRASSVDSTSPPHLVTPTIESISSAPPIATNATSNSSSSSVAENGNTAKLRKKPKQSNKEKERTPSGASGKKASKTLPGKSESSSSVSSETMEEPEQQQQQKATHSNAISSTATTPPIHPLTPTANATSSCGALYRVGCFRKIEITQGFSPALPQDALIPGACVSFVRFCSCFLRW
jgi:hypothetical protein